MDATEKAEFEKLLERLARSGNMTRGIAGELESHADGEASEYLQSAVVYISASRSNIQSAIDCIRFYMKTKGA